MSLAKAYKKDQKASPDAKNPRRLSNKALAQGDSAPVMPTSNIKHLKVEDVASKRSELAQNILARKKNNDADAPLNKKELTKTRAKSNAVNRKNAQEYTREEVIIGKILELTDDKVVLKCLVDKENKIFQIRSFDKLPFEGAVTLAINQFVEIKILTRSGERRFLYKNTFGKNLNTYFTPPNIFEGLENSTFFKPT